jgi:hypothetical protein
MSTEAESEDRVDVVRSEDGDGPVYVAVPAGRGLDVVAGHEARARKWRQFRGLLVVVGTLLTAALGLWLFRHLAGGVLGGVVPLVSWGIGAVRGERPSPEVVASGIDPAHARREYDLADVTVEFEE